MRFAFALCFLFAACAFQFLAGTFGISLDLVLAALFAFALVFEWPELLFLIALALFIVGWRPVWSPPVLIYAIFPLLFFGVRRMLSVNAWIAVGIAVAIGIGALAFSAGSGIALAYWPALFVDIAAGFCFALAALFALGHFS